jgi:MurNAc alpha-1-phosphate uridylyltransferase
MQAVVLAGGLATRLGDRARDTPKYLLPIAGKTFASWQLSMLASAGFTEVVLCIGHLGQQIRGALGDRHAGMTLAYVTDGPTPRGTGGALRHALPHLDDTVLVTYGDSYLPFDYAAPLRDLSAHPDAEASMSVFENHDRWDRSNTRVDGGRVLEYRKGAGTGFTHIDYGAIAMRKKTISDITDSDLADALSAVASRGRMRALLVEERFYEIGSAEGIAALEVHLS